MPCQPLRHERVADRGSVAADGSKQSPISIAISDAGREFKRAGVEKLVQALRRPCAKRGLAAALCLPSLRSIYVVNSNRLVTVVECVAVDHAVAVRRRSAHAKAPRANALGARKPQGR